MPNVLNQGKVCFTTRAENVGVFMLLHTNAAKGPKANDKCCRGRPWTSPARPPYHEGKTEPSAFQGDFICWLSALA